MQGGERLVLAGTRALAVTIRGSGDYPAIYCDFRHFPTAL
jgi:hypothetical protein